MQIEKIKGMLKATIYSLIVAFFIVFTICFLSVRFGKEKFLMAINLIDMITIENETEQKASPILKEFFEEENNNFVLLNPPNYGENYADLIIDSIEVNLPIYYGKTMDLLRNGIGHDNDSYFPGEGGSVILMGHNFSKFLARLPDVMIGDSIKVHTNYGDYAYTVYNKQVVDENETYKVPIQKDEEILMIYTCWPINNIGYTTDRYVVYAK